MHKLSAIKVTYVFTSFATDIDDMRTCDVDCDTTSDRATAQAVSPRLLTAKGQVRAHGSPWWWTKWHWDRFFFLSFGFLLSISFYRCFIFTHIPSGGLTKGPLAAAVPQRHSLTPSQRHRYDWHYIQYSWYH
jgi:hypothetical protein